MIELQHALMHNQVNYRQAVRNYMDPNKDHGEAEQLCQRLQSTFIELWIAQRYFDFVLPREDSIADCLMVEVPKELAQQDAVAEGKPLLDDGPYHRTCFSGQSSTSSYGNAPFSYMSGSYPEQDSSAEGTRGSALSKGQPRPRTVDRRLSWYDLRRPVHTNSRFTVIGGWLRCAYFKFGIVYVFK